MGLLREKGGKLSSKRVIGVLGSLTCLGVFIGMFFVSPAQISDTLLLGMFGASVALLGVSAFGKDATKGIISLAHKFRNRKKN